MPADAVQQGTICASSKLLVEWVDARCSSDQPGRRALLRLRDVLGDPVGANPGLRAFGHGAGGRRQGGDTPTATRRLGPLTGDRNRVGRRLVKLLLCVCGVSALDLSQGRRLHQRDGVPVCLNESRCRAWHHHGAAARLAVHPRRVRRRSADDRAARPPVSPVSDPSAGRRGARAGRQGPRRLDGGTRRDGHERPSERLCMAATAIPRGVHRDRELLRDGLGRDLARHRRSAC